MRAPCIALGLLGVWTTFLLGGFLNCQRHFNFTQGLCAAFLLAVNVLHYSVSAHIRFYTMGTLGAILATLALLKLCRSRKFTWLLVYVACMVFSVSSMALTIILLAPHLAYFIFTAPRRGRALVTALTILLLFGGYSYYLLERQPEQFEVFNYTVESSWEVAQQVFLENGNLGANLGPGDALVMEKGNAFFFYLMRVVCAVSLMLALAPRRWLSSWNTGSSSQAQISSMDIGQRQEAEQWLCPLIVISCAGFIILYSICWKHLDSAPNYCWLMPFVAIWMAQAWRYSVIRWSMLTAMLLLLPWMCGNTYVAYAIDSYDKYINAWALPNDMAVITRTERNYSGRYISNVHNFRLMGSLENANPTNNYAIYLPRTLWRCQQENLGTMLEERCRHKMRLPYALWIYADVDNAYEEDGIDRNMNLGQMLIKVNDETGINRTGNFEQILMRLRREGKLDYMFSYCQGNVSVYRVVFRGE